MKNSLKAACFLPFLALPAHPAWAGTELRARLESETYKDAWVNVQASIDHDKMRVDFRGPNADGALIYDRETSQLTLVDHLHKTVLPLTADDQTGVKLLLAVASGQLKGRVDGSNARRTFAIAENSARAFFNGMPVLKGKGVVQGGFACDEYVTDLKGKKAREVWVTDPLQAGMEGKDYNTFRSLAHLAVDLGDSVLAQLGADTAAFQENFSESQLPVAEVLYAKGKASVRFKVLGVAPRSFGADNFNPPADYKTVSLVELVKDGIVSNR